MKRFYIKKLRDVNTPTRSYDSAAGWDFYIPNTWQLLPGIKELPEYLMPTWEHKVIRPNNSLFIPTGIQLKMHKGFALRFDNKSGKARGGLLVGATIVDNDYQGEIHLNVWNVSNADVVVKQGEKLLQGIFFETPQIELYEIQPTEKLYTETSARGAKGFGSTGRFHK